MPMSVRSGVRFDGAVIWLVLAAATVGALYSSHFLPFYDYYQWLFQGHVVSDLLFRTDGDATGLAGAYTLDPVPVPNLAAPFGIGALNVFLPIEAAGQLFVVLTVLGFAGSFGYLVRTLQGRPTAVEYLGFLWAPGFYLYKGYLSFMVGLAIVFVLDTSVVADSGADNHRVARNNGRRSDLIIPVVIVPIVRLRAKLRFPD